MLNQPETPEKGPPWPAASTAEELVLPPPPAHFTPALPRASTPVQPPDLLKRPALPPPQHPLARLRFLWHKDPAYKVLLIAVVVVLLAGTVCAELVSSALLSNAGSTTASSPPPQTPPATAAHVNPRPTFAPPGGGKGSKTSSLPPAHGTTPPLPTATSDSNPAPAADTLTVQITSIPTHVRNFQAVAVTVATSAPGVTVYLAVQYSAAPHQGFAGPVISDDNGNATLNWLVSVYKGNGARASVVAVARDQNGQQVQSQAVGVSISGFSFGG
jgi:hypothetical protein